MMVMVIMTTIMIKMKVMATAAMMMKTITMWTIARHAIIQKQVKITR